MESGFFDVHPIFILDHNTHDILDVNNCAIENYGYSKDEFVKMNINDLGIKKKRVEVIGNEAEDDVSADKIWLHKTKEGKNHWVQYTTQSFNYNGRHAKMAVAHDVTEQVKNKEKNVNKFPGTRPKNGINNMAEIIWGADKKVLQWSEKAEDLFGWREDEVLGRNDFFKRFIHEEEHEFAFKKIDTAFRELWPAYQINGRIVDKNGDIKVCEWNNSIEYDEEGNVVAIYSLVQDITERKRQALLFESLTEKSLVGIYLIQDGVFKYVNPKFCEIFGYTKEEIEGNLGPVDLTAPQDRPMVRENVRKRIEKEIQSVAYDFQAKTKEGKILHIEAYGSQIEYLGKPAIIGSLLNITHSKLTAQRYKTSVESFENLFDTISDALHIVDTEGRFLKINDAAVALYGYERNELIGHTPAMLTAPAKNDMDKARTHFQKALDGKTQIFNFWAKRKSGEIFPEIVSASPGHYFGKKVVILISRDISDRMEVEKRVKQSEKQFWQLFRNAPLGIVMMDRAQDIRIVNPAFENMFGYTSDELKGLDLDKVIAAENSYVEAVEISKSVYEGGISAVKTQRKRKDGSLIDVLIYGVPVKIKETIIAIFGIYVDISDRVAYQQKIEKSLKEKEVMLAEIHHRVKNNLAVITGLLELQQYKTEIESAKDILKESQLRINSIALIHEKLYQNEDLSEVSIDVYLEELIEVIADSMLSVETDITIDIDAEATSLTITQAIPCGLILNELITNAYKHAFRQRDKGTISITLNSSNGIFYLTFEDDGYGIPETVDIKNPSSLGITLITTLSKQLNGEYSFLNKDEGMRFTLQFKIDR